MPIYEYRCSNCGHQQDYLQKVSDPVMTMCPACGQETYSKQVTAAGFQLKGSGWYATDFKGGGRKHATKDGGGAKTEAQTDAKAESKADAKSDVKSDSKSESKPTAKATTKATTPAEGGS